MSFSPPSVAVSPPPVSPRRRRQRPYRLSTDTTASISSLPAYSAPLRPAHSNWPAEDTPTDQPPDYPQSAEEADTEDIDSKQSLSRLRLPRSHQLQQHTRRIRQHRRGLSSLSSLSDIPPSPSVDDLLKRSVVALELSTNALLQSISSTSALSAIASDELPSSRSKMLDKQPSPPKDSFLCHHDHRHRQPWMDDFNDILRRVDGLLLPPGSDDGHAISRSLPTGTSIVPPKEINGHVYLNLTTSSELDLTRSHTARAPRALTQYVSVESNLGATVDATADDNSIFLPSTIGLRALSQIRQFSPSRPRVPPRQPPIHKSRSIDSASTATFNLPINVSVRQSSRSPSRRGVQRRHSAGSADTSTTITSGFKGIPLSTTTTRSSSRTSTPFRDMPPSAPHPPPVRAMTPPTEESTPISSSEDDRPLKSLLSLRKILDDSPGPKDRYSTSPAPSSLSSKLKFMPRTPAVVPSSGTSMATASVYRLFTRNSHHASSFNSRPKSSLKKPSPIVGTQPGSPSPGDSRQSSRPSTPRQVTFAELPAEFPGRPRSSKMKNKHHKGKVKSNGKEESRWLSWFTPSLGIGTSSGSTMSSGMAYEERMEDKMMRGWGRSAASTPGGVLSAEDWLV